MSRPNPDVDVFMSKAKHWRQEFETLRKIALASPLTEEMKWRLPCYTFENGNVAIIQGMKEYCALMFFKGALLKDDERVLVAPGATQAGRQIRFTNAREISKMEPILKAYIREAIEVEKAGLKVQLRKTSDFKIPEEFQKRLDTSPALKTAFHALTPGRQRAYLFYFAQPKQSQTREQRIEKSLPRILKGKGLDDR